MNYANEQIKLVGKIEKFIKKEQINIGKIFSDQICGDLQF